MYTFVIMALLSRFLLFTTQHVYQSLIEAWTRNELDKPTLRKLIVLRCGK